MEENQSIPAAEEQAYQPNDEQVQESVQEQVQEEPFITVKYDKEERPLTREEAITAAQKGLNYDRELQRRSEIEAKAKGLEDKLQSVQNQYGVFDKIAKHRGVPVDSIIKAAEESFYRSIDAEAAKDPMKLAREAREYREKIMDIEPKLETYEQREAEAKKKQEEDAVRGAEVAGFREKYPGVNLTDDQAEKISEWWGKGMPLTEAYELYQSIENERAAIMDEKKKLGVEAKNAENAAASTGAVAQDVGEQGSLTEEAISKMSPRELKKNHSKVWAFLTGQKG